MDILVDCSELQQTYTEDCQVCCRPMIVHVSIEDDGVEQSIDVHVVSEDDASY